MQCNSDMSHTESALIAAETDARAMAGETILIVDDVPVNLKLAGAILKREGYNIETAEDGEQAHLPRTTTSHTKPRIKHLESLAPPVPSACRSATKLALTASS